MSMPSKESVGDIIIGLVGTEKFIYRIAEVARQEHGAAFRLVTAACNRDEDVVAATQRIAGEVDVLLFSGPMTHDRAKQGVRFTVPATHVQTGGSTFPSTLLKLHKDHNVDISRISIDSVPEREVHEVYADLGVGLDDVKLLPYTAAESAQTFLDFHREHYQSGAATAAVTTNVPVAEKLESEGIVTALMQAAPLTLRVALQTAFLLGSDARMEDSRMAITVVQLPDSAVPRRAGASNLWFHELRLSLHRALLEDAKRMDAAVLPRDERSYLVISTLGSLRKASGSLTHSPFISTSAGTLPVQPEVGIGLGHTALQAEENAQTAIELALSDSKSTAYLVPRSGVSVILPTVTPNEAPEFVYEPDQNQAVLDKLVEAIRKKQPKPPFIVDAETVARLQGVTLRTARRTLHSLADAGMAWPMPPARAQKAGRPRIRFQLLDTQAVQ